MSKRLSKYIAYLDYFDKSLIALSVTTGSISLHHLQLLLGHKLGFYYVSLIFLVNMHGLFLEKIKRHSYC